MIEFRRRGIRERRMTTRPTWVRCPGASAALIQNTERGFHHGGLVAESSQMSYWDMAASLVTQGAIPARMFNEGNTEHFAVYAKLRPFLDEIRNTTRYTDYLQH